MIISNHNGSENNAYYYLISMTANLLDIQRGRTEHTR